MLSSGMMWSASAVVVPVLAERLRRAVVTSGRSSIRTSSIVSVKWWRLRQMGPTPMATLVGSRRSRAHTRQWVRFWLAWRAIISITSWDSSAVWVVVVFIASSVLR